MEKIIRTKEYRIAELEEARQHRQDRMSNLRQEIERFTCLCREPGHLGIAAILEKLLVEIEELQKLNPVQAKQNLR